MSEIVFAQYLENGWTEFDQILFCIHITIDKVWVGIVFFFHIATELQRYRATKLVFAQYLENKWTEFNQILNTYFL